MCGSGCASTGGPDGGSPRDHGHAPCPRAEPPWACLADQGFRSLCSAQHLLYPPLLLPLPLTDLLPVAPTSLQHLSPLPPTPLCCRLGAGGYENELRAQETVIIC